MKIAICDDELLSIGKFVNVLKSYLSEINIENEIDIYDDEMELLIKVRDGMRYDIYVADIDMKIPGDQLIKQIRHYDGDSLVAFVSSYENKGSAVCHAGGDIYVYKSMTAEEMLYEIKHLFTLFFNSKKSYSFRTPEGVANIELRTIKYIESYKRKVVVHLAGGSDMVIIGHTLASLECEGTFGNFIKVDRSHLVNHQRVHSLQEKSIRFDDGEELTLPREKLKQFQRQWRDAIFKEFI